MAMAWMMSHDVQRITACSCFSEQLRIIAKQL